MIKINGINTISFKEDLNRLLWLNEHVKKISLYIFFKNNPLKSKEKIRFVNSKKYIFQNMFQLIYRCTFILTFFEYSFIKNLIFVEK